MIESSYVPSVFDGVASHAASNRSQIEDAIRTGAVARVITITPAQAAQILNKQNFARQRPLRKSHVKFLESEIRQGTFEPGTPITFGRFQGRDVLVNGQHTLHAIANTGKSYTLTVIRREVDTETELAEMYYRQDSGLPRNSGDAFIATGLMDTTGLNFSQVQRLASASGFLRTGFRDGRRDKNKDRLLAGVVSWTPEAQAYFDVLKGVPSAEQAPFLRNGVFSVALALFRHQPEQARVFFEAAVRDDGLGRHDPRKVLHDYLTADSIRNQAAPNRRTVTSAFIARVVAATWNAFSKGKEMKQKQPRVFDTNSPIVLEGTPYDGNDYHAEVVG